MDRHRDLPVIDVVDPPGQRVDLSLGRIVHSLPGARRERAGSNGRAALVPTLHVRSRLRYAIPGPILMPRLLPEYFLRAWQMPDRGDPAPARRLDDDCETSARQYDRCGNAAISRCENG